MPTNVTGKIQKPSALRTNLADYETVRRSFSWADAEKTLAGLPGGRGLNIAYEAADRHVAEGRGDRVALRWIAKDQAVNEVTYARLTLDTAPLSNLLPRP